MLIETGHIISIEKDALWIETYQKSVCGSCQAKSGCGQSLLGKFGARATRMKVSLNNHLPQDFVVGQEIKLGIEETAFIRGVLYLYWMPLVFMLAALFIAHAKHLGEGTSVLLAFGGLLFGAFCARVFTQAIGLASRTQPVIID